MSSKEPACDWLSEKTRSACRPAACAILASRNSGKPDGGRKAGRSSPEPDCSLIPAEHGEPVRPGGAEGGECAGGGRGQDQQIQSAGEQFERIASFCEGSTACVAVIWQA